MKKISTILLLIFTFSCQNKTVSNSQSSEKPKRLKERIINNGKYSASIFHESTISDINSFVTVKNNSTEKIVYKGSSNSVVDIYFKGKDTLFLKIYKPNSGIQYEYEPKFETLNILKDTLVTNEEYMKLTH